MSLARWSHSEIAMLAMMHMVEEFIINFSLFPLHCQDGSAYYYKAVKLTAKETPKVADTISSPGICTGPACHGISDLQIKAEPGTTPFHSVSIASCQVWFPEFCFRGWAGPGIEMQQGLGTELLATNCNIHNAVSLCMNFPFCAEETILPLLLRPHTASYIGPISSS